MTNIKALLIEDEPAAQELYRHIFDGAVETGSQYHIATVATMAEARAVLKLHTTLDLVLLDLKLPNGAGVSLIKEIKALAPTAALVVITGLSGDDIEREAFDLLIDDFVLKTRETGPEIVRICRKAVARAKARMDIAASIKSDAAGRAEEALRRWELDPNLPPHEDLRKRESDKQQETVLEKKR